MHGYAPFQEIQISRRSIQSMNNLKELLYKFGYIPFQFHLHENNNTCFMLKNECNLNYYRYISTELWINKMLHPVK